MFTALASTGVKRCYPRNPTLTLCITMVEDTGREDNTYLSISVISSTMVWYQPSLFDIIDFPCYPESLNKEIQIKIRSSNGLP